MTSPTPPPGWHPDPAGTGRQRWWDGTTWTEMYGDTYPYAASQTPQNSVPPQPTAETQPVADLASADEAPEAATPGNDTSFSSAGPPPPPQKRTLTRGNKIALGVGAGVVALIAVSAIAGAGEDEESTTTASTTSRVTPTAPQETTTRPPAPVTTTVAPPAPATKTTPAKPLGCQQAPPEYLDVINSSWLNGYQLTDVSAFSVGETWYIAGEVTQDGEIRSRDDLFAAKDLLITPVTATARLESTLPDLRRILDVNFLDDGAQKALDCARTY